MTILNNAEQVVQDVVHPAAETSSIDSHEQIKDNAVSPYDCESEMQLAGACDTVQNSEKWAVMDSNHRPPACRAGALTN